MDSWLFRNTKKQGDGGLGMAIGWFSMQGYTVCVPITDSQEYDLVVDTGPSGNIWTESSLNRVQVKTTKHKAPSGCYKVSLSVKGGNRSAVGKVTPFDNQAVDSIFVLCEDGTMYWMPSANLGTSNVTLNESKSEWIVTF